MDNESQDLGTQQKETNSEPMYVVFDIPISTTAEEAASLLNEPFQRGFYIHSIAAWLGNGGVGARVFAKRITHPRTATPLTPELQGKTPLQMQAAAADALRALLAADPRTSVTKLRTTLRKLGHGKGHAWVQETRDSILRG